jgi:FkbM family methyltransferase
MTLQLQNLGLRMADGKIFIPQYATTVSIDVGLSVNAPQSAIWLERNAGLFVIGFEPIQSNIDAIYIGKSQWPINLDPRMIGTRISIVKAALSNENLPDTRNFYVTKNDPGCSSFLKPINLEVDRIEVVSVFTLDEVLSYFPFDRIAYIDHLKVDAQGTDFDVIKGVDKNLSRILFITLEIDTQNYFDGNQTEKSVSRFLRLHGFCRIKNSLFGQVCRRVLGINIHLEVDDPTYINLALYKKLGKPRKYVYQQG